MARIKLDYPDAAYTYSTTMTVRTSDLNGNHLGFDAVVSLVGNARNLFLRHHDIDEHGTPGVIVADLAVTYSAEAFLHDELRFDAGVVDRNTYGGDIVYRVTRPADGTLIATAKTGIVFFDYATKRVTAAPPAFTALFGDEG